MKKRNLSLAILAVLALVLCAGPAMAQIKSGVHAPLTGPAAADGKSCKIAAEMAVEKLNKEGGVLGQKVELVIYDDQAKAEQAAREAAANAARNAALQDYAGKIASLIRSRANIPDTVSGKPALTVRLRLLVNGVIFDAQVIKPSGNRVYDEAVERATNGIRQWPLPENAELFGNRRELNLNIEHER